MKRIYVVGHCRSFSKGEERRRPLIVYSSIESFFSLQKDLIQIFEEKRQRFTIGEVTFEYIEDMSCYLGDGIFFILPEELYCQELPFSG